MKPSELIAFAKDKKISMIDLRFVDWPGMWQHFSVPVEELTEECFEDGFGFDGSSIRGWQPINLSDMLVIPDVTTAQLDPFYRNPTLVLICNIVDPITRQPYTRDPRNIARKAEDFLRGTGIGDTAFVGPEAEFFVFDHVSYDVTSNGSFYRVDSDEGHWNTGRQEGANLGYKPRPKEGYFPVPPSDHLHDLRTEMCLVMNDVGISIEAQHHEVATGGQCEIDMRFGPMLTMADRLMWYKYIVKNVARRHGKTATFMPKPLYGDNGSGMHTHMSIWKDNKPLFAGDRYGGISEMAMHFIGGILKHAPALVALTNPTTNSYKRLVPGFEAPVNLAYSSRNRSAAVRLPTYSPSPKSKRIEFRSPDPSCNPYLAFAAMLMAGLDGIQKRTDPGDPLDKDIYALTPEQLAEVPSLPGCLDDAIANLEKDSEFLLAGDVFTPDAIEMWIRYKRENEIAPVSACPHPKEFDLYYDI